MALTLKQIEAFQAVMVAGTVTRAATRLGVSQPAISRMIADLEGRVGFALFARTARQLVPTIRARTLQAEVERAFLGLKHIEVIAEALREHGEGQLRLAVVPSLVPIISSRLIAPFTKLYPTASLSIEVVATLNALDWLTIRHCDIGITFEVMSGRGFEIRRIGQTEAACVLPAGHALARRAEPVRSSDLAGETFISYMTDSGFRGDLDRALAQAGISFDRRFEVRTTAAACELVAALGAVTVVPTPGPQLAADRRLVMLPFVPRLTSDVILVQAAGLARAPLAKAFVDFAIGQGIDFQADLRPREDQR
jgi:DNA-binding transcriptional LysR family regulator